MKDLMKNLFQNPKVCFMLAVICLSPVAESLGCPPPDCSAEAQGLTNALNALATARATFFTAWNTYRNAMQRVEVDMLALQAAQQSRHATLVALLAAIASKNGLMITATFLLWRAAKAREAAAQAALNLSQRQLSEARAAYDAATAALNTAINNVNAARQAYNECLNG